MALKYYCEFCGTRFHTSPAALRCSKLLICRSMNFIPKEIESEWKVRGCALVLSEVVADSLEKNIARLSELRANYDPRVAKRGHELLARLRMWNLRVNSSIKAVTPIGMGKASRIHNNLVDFIFKRAWNPKKPIPILHATEIANRFAFDACEWVRENASDRFWFEEKYPDFVMNETVSMPLASHISKMKDRGHISKELDSQIIAWATTREGVKIEGKGTLKLMLSAAWQDELRSWNFIQATTGSIQKWLVKSFDEQSLAYEYDDDSVYAELLEYIWNDGEEKRIQQEKIDKICNNMKLYLVNNRIYIAAQNKQEAKALLLKELSIVASSISSMYLEKDIYNADGSYFGTGKDMIRGISKAKIL